eukprot:1919588-Pleurochrysis_carterae.AAC.1
MCVAYHPCVTLFFPLDNCGQVNARTVASVTCDHWNCRLIKMGIAPACHSSAAGPIRMARPPSH